MRMVHGDFKVGETCQGTGDYVCVTCQRAGRRSSVHLEEGGTFPFCPLCRDKAVEEVDVVWKKIS